MSVVGQQKEGKDVWIRRIWSFLYSNFLSSKTWREVISKALPKWAHLQIPVRGGCWSWSSPSHSPEQQSPSLKQTKRRKEKVICLKNGFYVYFGQSPYLNLRINQLSALQNNILFIPELTHLLRIRYSDVHKSDWQQ